MKIILLVAGGRTGNEFFHSLLDSHSEILQFPGILVTDNNFIKIQKNTNSIIPDNKLDIEGQDISLIVPSGFND